MVCKKCGAALKEDQKFCDQCGQKVEEIQTPLVNDLEKDELFKKLKKKNRKYIVIALVIIAAITLAFIGLFVFLLNLPENLHGTWKCEDGSTMVFEKNGDFRWYQEDRDEMDVHGTYSYSMDYDMEDSLTEYDLTLNASSAMIDGEQYNRAMRLHYNVTVYDESENQMMIQTDDKKLGSYCTKQK